MARTEASLKRALAAIPKLREEFWHNVSVPGDAEQPEPEPRVRRPRRRLPRVRRAAGARRAATGASRAAATSARRARPPTARRCATTSTIPTWRRGSSPASASPPELHKEPLDVRGGAADAAELQVNASQSARIWRQAGPERRGTPRGLRRPTASRPTCRSSRCWTSSTRGWSAQGEDAIAFDSDCREGICGMCSLVVNGVPHGPDRGTTVCQLHMRRFKDGDTITIEPWRAKAFPVVKDLVVDRSAFDRIIAAGGYVSVNAAARPTATPSRSPRTLADDGDGLGRLHRLRRLRRRLQERVGAPVHGRQDSPPRAPAAGPRRAAPPGGRDGRRRPTRKASGSCSNEGECEAVCPKEIPISNIARMTREYLARGVLEITQP